MAQARERGGVYGDPVVRVMPAELGRDPLGLVGQGRMEVVA